MEAKLTRNFIENQVKTAYCRNRHLFGTLRIDEISGECKVELSELERLSEIGHVVERQFGQKLFLYKGYENEKWIDLEDKRKQKETPYTPSDMKLVRNYDELLTGKCICGTTVHESSKYCQECGQKLNWSN